jgi:hypothetical protein
MSGFRWRLSRGASRFLGDVSLRAQAEPLGIEESRQDAEPRVLLWVVLQGGAVQNFSVLDYRFDLACVADVFGLAGALAN